MTESYTAANIRILTQAEAIERFDFALADALADRYPHVPPDFIARMVEACRLSGYAVEDAERRYLLGDKSVAVTPEFQDCHRELVRAQRR